MTKYFRHIAIILVGILSTLPTFSYDFEIDGLCYNKLSDNEVEVTYKKYDGNSYSGTITIPSSVTYNGSTYTVKTIGNRAFYNCTKLTGSLTIPNTVTSIGNYAFQECSGFTGNLFIPNLVTRIGDDAFTNCRGFTGNLTIPQSVTYIGKFAFSGCAGFNGFLTISNSVNSISEGAFEGCRNFTGDLIIPNSVTTISHEAFKNCRGFSGNLIIPNTVTTIEPNVFEYCIGFTGDLVIPNSVTVIGYNAFNNCYGFNGRLIISNSIKTLSAYVFAHCSGLTGDLIIPNSVTSINHYAFYECSSFTGVLNIPNSVKKIETGAFESCNNINKVLSAIASPFSIPEDVFSGLSSDATLQVPSGTKKLYLAYIGWTKNFKEIVEMDASPAIYTLSITATGNGIASYMGTSIRSKTSTFTVNEGTNATISFSEDNGYRIKSVKVNSSDVTSSVSSNQYTVSNIQANTTLEVEFESIPVSTYTLSIKSTGSGSVSYDGTTIRSKTSTFTVNEGSSATITFSPDNGYRMKSMLVNSSDVTSYASSNKYTISSISRNTTVEVDFEAIPVTTYTLSIKSTGSGSVSYDGTTIRSKTSTFTVNEGSSATITFSPDNGYRIKSVLVNSSNVTSSVSSNKYTISSISRNTSVEVEFEAIPVTTYTLSIKATGNGSVSYDGNTIRSKTSTFTINEGTSATISFNPDNGYRVKSVKVNSSDVTSNLSNYRYTISNINKNTSVEVEFQEELKTFTSDGLNYAVLSYDDKTVSLANGKYGTVLEVPATITYQDITWKVAGIDNAALANNEELAAIIWNPSAAFNVSVSNPNLLLYVKSASYAPATIQNVVVNSTAESIVLTDAASGNNFYCPKEFTAKKISYIHNYGMITGLGESRGWETIALPFDVKKIAHSSKGELTPFVNWRSGDSKKPFWLMSYGASGWANASSIKANTPYIISMPNNPDYKAEFRLSGNITFSAENVTVKKSDNLQTGNYGGNTFTPNFFNTDNSGYLALNVNNDYVSYSGGSAEGSTFVVNLRPVHPFEAYMTSTSKTRSTISINGDMATGIEDMSVLMDESKGLRIYNLKGQLIKVEQDKSLDEVRRSLPAGVYIVNGKKLIIK